MAIPPSSALVVATPPSSTLTVAKPYSKASGAGLILYQSFEICGEVLDNSINRIYNRFRGPQNVGKVVEIYFGDGHVREAALDRCATDQKARKLMQGYCRDLLSYAKAHSNSAETQLVAFKIIFTLVTRYPGIRPLFKYPECSSSTTITSDPWCRLTSDECDGNWHFYHNLAEYCLRQTKLSDLIESSEMPSKFTQLSPIREDGPLTKERLEDLLSFCRDDAEYDNEKICAIRYLAAVLELPSFWKLSNPDNMNMTKRLFGFLSDLWSKILQMLEDTTPDSTEDGQKSVLMLVKRQAVDGLVYATFKGLLLLHGSNLALPTISFTFLKAVELLKRPDMQDHFPTTLSCVSQFEAILRPYSLKADGEEEVSLNEAMLPLYDIYARFRILVVGNSGVGKSSLINEVFVLPGTDKGAAIVSHLRAGEADIEREITPADNSQLILHDSQGFEAGEGGNLETVVKFIKSRNAMETLQDKLHAVWLCLRIPVAGRPLAGADIEKLLAMRESGEFGDLPFIFVYTQYDKLVTWVKYELRSQDEVQVTERVETVFKESCLKPFEGKAKFPYTRVSTKADYKDTIAKLVKVTLDNISKDSLAESYSASAIPQRDIPWLKIQMLIDGSRRKDWKSVFVRTVFRGHSLEKGLNVLHTDVIAVWNLSDYFCYLRSREFQVLLYDMVQDVVQAVSSGSSSQGEALATNLRMVGTAATFVSDIAGGAAAAPIVVPIAVTRALLQWVHKPYSDSHDVLKRLMAYVVNLIFVMQNIFLIVQAQSRQTSVDIWMINVAVRTYKMSHIKAQIHTDIVDFVDKGDIADHSRSNAVDRIAGIIERYRKESAELMKQKMSEEDPSKDEHLRIWGVELPKV